MVYRDSRGRFTKRPAEIEEKKQSLEDRLTHKVGYGDQQQGEGNAVRTWALPHLVFRILLLIFLLLLVSLLFSCSTSRQPQVVTVERVSREVVTLRDTLVRVQLVPQQDSITTTDTTSTLHNSYCESTAVVSHGHLTHTLSTLTHSTHEVPIQVREVVRTDSIPYPVCMPGPTEYIEKPIPTLYRIILFIGCVSIGFMVAKTAKFIRHRFFS